MDRIEIQTNLASYTNELRLSYEVINRSDEPVYLLDQILDLNENGLKKILNHKVIVTRESGSKDIHFILGHFPHPTASVSNAIIPAARILDKRGSLKGEVHLPLPLAKWHPDIGYETLYVEPVQAMLKVGLLGIDIKLKEEQSADGLSLFIPTFTDVFAHQKFVNTKLFQLDECTSA